LEKVPTSITAYRRLSLTKGGCGAEPYEFLEHFNEKTREKLKIGENFKSEDIERKKQQK
jgi:hypothetical protein